MAGLLVAQPWQEQGLVVVPSSGRTVEPVLGRTVIPGPGRAVVPDDDRMVMPRPGRWVMQSHGATTGVADRPRKIPASLRRSRVTTGTIFGAMSTTCGGVGIARRPRNRRTPFSRGRLAGGG
jgi:hypothetical protein